MAKKKTAEKAKIEAAPVLRSNGDDPTPETSVITKSYIMRDDWKDKGVVNTVAFKSVDGEVQNLLVNGEPAGGGGGVTGLIQINITGACTGGEGYELFVDNLTDGHGNFVGIRVNDSDTGFTKDGVIFTSSTPITKAFYIPEAFTLPVLSFVSGMGGNVESYIVTGSAEKIQTNPEDPSSWMLSITGDFSISGPGEN